MSPRKNHPSPKFIQISKLHWNQILQHVRSLPGEEVCGILGGQAGETTYLVELVLPVTNDLHSPARYRMQPREQLDALFTIEERGLDVVAIYHSHLNGSALPSATDVAEARYPEAIQLIWSCQAAGWQCRGYMIQQGVVSEITIQQPTGNDG